jgi:erythritol transport system substrate-binding protein
VKHKLRLPLVTAVFLLAVMLCSCKARDMRKLIVIVVPSQDNPYFKAEADAAATRATELGYRVRVDAHNDDAYRQDNLIDAAIASNAAILILDNAGTDASISAVRRATKAGIACFLIDREITAHGIAKAQIVSDNDQGARLVAAEFSRSMGGSGEYVELLGRESDTNAQVRTKGFHAVLDREPGLKMVAAQSANWSQAEAFQKTETMLQAHGHIGGIVAGNDTMALGAAAAVKSAGLKGLKITGFDGSPDAVAAITSGEMLATALQPAAVISEMAVNEADTFLKTGSTGKPEMQVIPCDLVTKANAAEYVGFARVTKDSARH